LKENKIEMIEITKSIIEENHKNITINEYIYNEMKEEGIEIIIPNKLTRKNKERKNIFKDKIPKENLKEMNFFINIMNENKEEEEEEGYLTSMKRRIERNMKEIIKYLIKTKEYMYNWIDLIKNLEKEIKIEFENEKYFLNTRNEFKNLNEIVFPTNEELELISYNDYNLFYNNNFDIENEKFNENNKIDENNKIYENNKIDENNKNYYYINENFIIKNKNIIIKNNKKENKFIKIIIKIIKENKEIFYKNKEEKWYYKLYEYFGKNYEYLNEKEKLILKNSDLILLNNNQRSNIFNNIIYFPFGILKNGYVLNFFSKFEKNNFILNLNTIYFNNSLNKFSYLFLGNK
jgi:hypothetical protein